jgi:hypothetical protein
MNTSKRMIGTLFMALFFAVTFSSSARADEKDRATKLTFSEPVEVPGQVLTPGTYWFTIVDNPSNRNIVRIWNADRTRMVKTILAIPDYRMRPTQHTVINFAERPSGSPEAIESWFYPGLSYGQEFVYPKTRATLLAKQTGRPVLSMPDERVSDPEPVIQQAPVKAVTPSGEEVEMAEVVATQEVAQAAPPASLPQTGSLLPLVGLLGLLSLAGGFTLRAVAQKAM